MVLSIRRHNGKNFLLLILYSLLFCACHPIIAESFWHYYASAFINGGAYGLRFHRTNFIIGIPMLLIYCFYGSQISRRKGMKYKIYFMLIVAYFIPLTTSAFMIAFDTNYLILSFVFFLFIVLDDILVSSRIAGDRIEGALLFSNEKRERAFPVFSLALVGLAIVMGYLYGNGFAMLLVDDVYVIRALNKARHTHWIIIALYKFLVYAMAVLAYYFVKRRKVGMLILAAVGAVLIYSIACMKSYLYVFVLSCVCSMFSRKVKLRDMPLVMVIIALAGIITFRYMNDSTIINVFRRFCITPAQLGDGYYSFIIKDRNSPVWIAESFPRIGLLLGITSPYNENLEYIIGRYWYGLPLDGNTGLLGAGIGNYGLLAVVICPMGLAITTNLVDRFTRRIESEALQFTIALVLVTEMMNQNYYNLEFIRPGWVILFILFLTLIPDVNSAYVDREREDNA